jgi:hypothetical protein
MEYFSPIKRAPGKIWKGGGDGGDEYFIVGGPDAGPTVCSRSFFGLILIL